MIHGSCKICTHEHTFFHIRLRNMNEFSFVLFPTCCSRLEKISGHDIYKKANHQSTMKITTPINAHFVYYTLTMLALASSYENNNNNNDDEERKKKRKK